MKNLFIIVLVACIRSSDAQVPETLVTDSTLTKVIDMFLDSVKVPDLRSDLYVITATFRHINIQRIEKEVPDKEFGKAFIVKERISYDLEISLERNISYFEMNTPSFSFVHRNRMILLFTGVEKLIRVSEKDNKRVVNRLRNFLPHDYVYVPPTWWFKIDGEKISVVSKTSD